MKTLILAAIVAYVAWDIGVQMGCTGEAFALGRVGSKTYQQCWHWPYPTPK